MSGGGDRDYRDLRSLTVGAGFDDYVRLALCAASGDGAQVTRVVSSLPQPPAVIARTLVRHQITSSVVHALDEIGDPSGIGRDLRSILDDWARRAGFERTSGLEMFDEAQEALACAGIPVLILKGPVLAERLYGGFERRFQSDVDLLVKRADRRKAEDVLGDLGYRRKRRDQHAVVLSGQRGVLDLHWALRSAPAYRISEVAVWADCPEVVLGSVTARTLSDEYLLLLLSVGLAEDAGLGMAKLKQLCDLWLLVRQIDAQQDWAGWLERRRAERLDGLAQAGLELMTSVSQTGGEAPRLAAALASRAGSGTGRRESLALLDAPRHDPGSKRWFAGLYPGSILLYRLHSMLAGFPHSLRESGPLRRIPGPPATGWGAGRADGRLWIENRR